MPQTSSHNALLLDTAHPTRSDLARYRTRLNFGENTLSNIDSITDRADRQLAATIRVPMEDSILANEQRQVSSTLERERQRIGQLDNPKAQTIYSRFTTPRISPFVRGIIETSLQAVEHTPERHQATNDSAVGKFIVALVSRDENGQPFTPDASLLNVLQWYSHQQSTTYEAFETVEAENNKTEYVQRVESAIREGILPEIARSRLPILFESPVSVSDGTHEQHQDLHGAFSLGDGIIIRHDVINTPYERGTILHEFTHAISSHAIDTRPSLATTQNLTHKCGLAREFDGGVLRTLNEAMTELTAEALETEGEYIERGAYTGPRNLIIALCEASGGAITMRDFVNAYFTAHASEKRSSHAAELNKKLHATFSAEIIDTLMELPDNAAYEQDGTPTQMSQIANLTKDIYLHYLMTHSPSGGELTRITNRLLNTADNQISASDFLRRNIANMA